MNLLRPVAAAGLHLRLRIQDVEEAFRIDERVVHIVKNALELCDGGDDVGEKHHVVHDLTDGHARVLDEHQIGREDDHQHRTHLLDEALEAIVVEAHAARLHLVGRHLVLDFQLFVRLNLFPVEALDDIDGVDDVLDALALAFQVRAHFPPPSLQALGLPVGNPEIHRDDPQGHQPHIDIGREHEDEGQQGAGEQRQQVDEEILHRARKAAHALVDTGLDLSGSVFRRVEERHLESEHLLDDRLRQVPRNKDAHPLSEVILRKGDERRQDFLAKQDYRNDNQDFRSLSPGKVRADERIDGVHRPVQHNGVHLRHQGPHQRKDEGDDDQPAVRPDERPDVFEKSE